MKHDTGVPKATTIAELGTKVAQLRYDAIIVFLRAFTAPPLRTEASGGGNGGGGGAQTNAATETPAAAAHPSVESGGESPDLHRLLAIEVPVIVQLGVRRMTVGEVMRFAVGAIIEFSKSAEEELELLINNKPVGNGHAVKVGENFGIKLTRIASVKETIRKLGAA